jgi:hypothetical protein
MHTTWIPAYAGMTTFYEGVKERSLDKCHHHQKSKAGICPTDAI